MDRDPLWHGINIQRHSGPALGIGGPGKGERGRAEGEAGLPITLYLLICVRIKWGVRSMGLNLTCMHSFIQSFLQSTHVEHYVLDSGALIKPDLILSSLNGFLIWWGEQI